MSETTAANAGIDASALDLLRDKALQQLRSNVRRAYDPYYRRRFAYVQPSPGRYEWMWFWDACFHVIALARLDIELARGEFECLIAAQDADGFIGHVTYWGCSGARYAALFGQSRPFAWRPRHSHYIQPPLLAQALERLYAAAPDPQYLARQLPKVIAYYDWLGRVRLDDSTGLLAIVSPFESGLDNSPAYDAPMGLSRATRLTWLIALRRLDLVNTLRGGRPGLPAVPRNPRFAVYDLLVNCAYADGLRTLARLCQAAGIPGYEGYVVRAGEVERALNERCWDEERGLFFHVDRRTGQLLRTSTAPSLLPALLPSTPSARRERVIEQHLRNPAEYWVDFPVPSVARSEPSFDPAGQSMIWRGPSAINLNWLIVRGLRQAGLRAEADHIAARSVLMADRHGFREFYNPLTGDGMRGTRFGWATCVVDIDAAGDQRA